MRKPVKDIRNAFLGISRIHTLAKSCKLHTHLGSSEVPVFRKAAQSLVRPWALILGGRLYGAKISVENYLYLFPYTVRPTLYRVWKLFRYLCLRSRLYCAPNMDHTYIYCVWILCECVVVQTQAICNCRITARAVIWSTSYFPNVSIFLLTALGSLPENPGIFSAFCAMPPSLSLVKSQYLFTFFSCSSCFHLFMFAYFTWRTASTIPSDCEVNWLVLQHTSARR